MKAGSEFKIYSHQNPDMDSIFSILAVLYFFYKKNLQEFFSSPGWRSSIIFRPANWDGKEIGPNDIAVDIHAGGKGIKGEACGGKVGSAFSQVMEKYASREMNQAMADFICYVDTSDSSGDVLNTLAGDYMEELPFKNDFLNILKSGSLETSIRALKSVMTGDFKSQQDLIAYFAKIFLGYIKISEQNLRAKELYASRVQPIVLSDGVPVNGSPVCINMHNAPFSLCDLAFERGAEVIIFHGQSYDGKGMVGIKRRPGSKFPIRHQKIISLIKNKKENWFSCDHMICTGTPKAPPKFQTEVLVSSLCVAVHKVYREFCK